jgi:hypothetical protein
MSTQHEAEAIAELGREQTIDARRYLDAWASLARSCVPVHTIRHVLDKPKKATEALKAVDAWGGRGPMLMLGKMGFGKSFAAAEWLRRLHLEGRPGHWLTMASWVGLTFAEQRAELDRSTSASALVIDDLGAGGSAENKLAREWINGLILKLFGDGVPVILAANGDLDTLRTWIDGRIISRLGEVGKLEVVGGGNMRAPDTDDVSAPGCPCGARRACGHGTRWRDAFELVELLGCERDPRATPGHWDGEVWHADGPTVMEWSAGRKLIDTETDRANLRAREILGLGRDQVLDLANAKLADDKRPQLRTQFEEALLRMCGAVGGRSNTLRKQAGRERTKAELEREELARARTEHRIKSRMLSMGEDEQTARTYVEIETERDALAAQGRREDNIARSRSTRAAMAKRAGTPTGASWGCYQVRGAQRAVLIDSEPARWTQGDNGRAKLRACGFAVKGPPGAVCVLYQGEVKLHELGSTEAGWDAAARVATIGWP